MGTRMLSEALIRDRFPHLRYVRIHTSGRHSATIYAWDDQLQLLEADLSGLKRYASTHLVPYVCFQIKDYAMLRQEKVPPVPEVPDCVAQAALNRSLDLQGIVSVINPMLPHGRMVFDHYDPDSGTVHMCIYSALSLLPIERELMDRYLYELIPLGSKFEVSYG